jgi:MinD-like ATPase involved in chromosome partitioning or flagellar assembly
VRDVPIAIVVSPRDWAERLHRFLADHGGARVRARVLDAREAVEDGHEVLVAEDLTSFLTPRLVDDLHAVGRRVLGVYDPDEPWGRERLLTIGVDATIPATAAPEDFVRTIVDLAVDLPAAGDPRDLGDRPPPDVERRPTAPGAPEPRRGAVVVVGGPPGGVGITEVAIHLADALGAAAGTGAAGTGAAGTGAAGGDGRSLLVDADLIAPSVAQRLHLDLHPNVRTAVDVFEHERGPVEGCTIPARGGFDVVSGSPHPTAWQELRPREVVGAVRALADGRRVVVDVGSGIEELATAFGPHRHAVGRALLADADRIVAVCAPDPVGVSRLIRWMSEVRRIAPATTVLVAVNRTPAGRYRRAELEDEICHSLGAVPVGFLPEDRGVGTAAWTGELCADRSPFLRAVGNLATVLAESLAELDASADGVDLEPAEVVV